VTTPTKADPYGFGEAGRCGGIEYGRNTKAPRITISPNGTFFGQGTSKLFSTVTKTTVSGSFKNGGRTASGTIRFRSRISGHCNFNARFQVDRI